jgi:hypothetical protein
LPVLGRHTGKNAYLLAFRRPGVDVHLPAGLFDVGHPDSRGFLWFCTNEGLSRFDGYGFTNYSTDQGLP